MKYVYAGSKYYNESNTMMGYLYEIRNNEYIRTDFCKVQIALDCGCRVYIRPATRKEIKMFDNMLAEYKEDKTK